MTDTLSLADKLFCVNCNVYRAKDEWREIPVKGRKAPVKRCVVCLRKKALRTEQLKKRGATCS